MVKRYTRSKKGGNYIPSAWDFVEKVVGTPNVQYKNALEIQPADNIVARASNEIQPVGKPNFGTGPWVLGGGKRRSKRRSKRRTKRGGNWSGTLKQAAVPLSLWGMQYFTKSKKSPYKRSRSRRSMSRKNRRR